MFSRQSLQTCGCLADVMIETVASAAGWSTFVHIHKFCWEILFASDAWVSLLTTGQWKDSFGRGTRRCREYKFEKENVTQLFFIQWTSSSSSGLGEVSIEVQLMVFDTSYRRHGGRSYEIPLRPFGSGQIRCKVIPKVYDFLDRVPAPLRWDAGVD